MKTEELSTNTISAPANHGSELTFRIKGMDCASCAQSIENGVARLDGVAQCTLNFTTETLRVQGDIASEQIVARVENLGYEVASPDEKTNLDEGSEPSSLNFWQYMRQRSDTRLALIGVILILPGLLFNELLPMLELESPWLNLTSIAAMIVAGLPIAKSAWQTLRFNRDISINLLMTIAAIGAVIIGAYTEAGLVMVLFAIGEALEGFTSTRARDSIRSLMQVAPQTATVLRPCIDCEGHMGQDGYDGGICPWCGLEKQEVQVDELQISELILVKPGERIPMDGRIRTGHSAINQAPITGESQPIDKIVGDQVFASSINGQGVLEIEVTHLASDNTISRIIKMVEDAQEKKAPSQRVVDRFAKIYTPLVVGIAILVATIPPLFFGQPFLNPDADTQGWLYRALALLVVACPCALVISTPVSIISAISNAARNGVLVKGGAYLEALSRVKVVAMDKTGTLTRGEPAMVALQAVNCEMVAEEPCEPCAELLALAGAVEQNSEHPLARAITTASTSLGVNNRYPDATAVTALTGHGVTGQVNAQTVTIGNHRYFDDAVTHNAAQCAIIDAAEAKGYTTMLVERDGAYQGYIATSDQVRPTSKTAVSHLRELGIETVMLTGDNPQTAQQIAAEVGVTDVRASLLPEDKVTAVQQLLAAKQDVAMIGDGINDAPALATASVGIAMGAAGTAQAMETADIALMKDNLSRLPFAIQLSRKMMQTIRVNIWLSIGIKVLFLIIVMLGFGSMWLAVIADMGTSLLVTLNGTRLLKRPLPNHI
ncbi:MAG: cation-translocating P-type ATPase [Chloroflexi bacterium]|nr:cation-translocating P-type ATPase [Chloroflexota bacterium]